jgi:hypothetical protein
VNADEALKAIRGYARAGRIGYVTHAQQRMVQRGARAADVRHALVNASSTRPSDDDKWRVVGPDLDGDDLEVVVALEGRVIVVTVF